MCKACHSFVRAPAPARVVDGGQYGPGLVARTVVQKLADSIPLYRQAKIYGREGLLIARSTLVVLFHRAASLVEPIYNRLLAEIPKSPVVYADETSLKMQRVEKLAFIWTFATEIVVAYTFSKDRSGETPVRVLGDSQGELVVDGYTGYNHVTLPGKAERGGCNAHARLKFVDIDDDRARQVIELYKPVFAVEEKAQNRGIVGTAEHRALRQERSRPSMEAIHAWCEQHAPQVTPKSPLGEAFRYLNNQWPYLTRFVDHVEIAPHNNLSERLLRTVALGRRNWLFVGHDLAGQNAAMLLSLIATCTLHQVDPEAYLADILLRVQDHPNSSIDELLPHRWHELFGFRSPPRLDRPAHGLPTLGDRRDLGARTG
jgi:transposase